MMTQITKRNLLNEYNTCVNNTLNEASDDDFGNLDSLDMAERREDLKGRPWELEVIDSSGNTLGYAYTFGHTRDGKPMETHTDNVFRL